MKIIIIQSHDDIISFEWECNAIKSALSGIKLHYGDDLIKQLLTDNYKYVLTNSENPESAIALDADVIGSSFDGFDTLVIVRDISGNIPAVAIVAALGAVGVTGVTATSLSVIALTALVNIGLSMALNAVMSLLSPTPEFSGDPAQAQTKKSNLFNGAPIIREQGCVAPISIGRPFCGGVLISSSITSEDV